MLSKAQERKRDRLFFTAENRRRVASKGTGASAGSGLRIEGSEEVIYHIFSLGGQLATFMDLLVIYLTHT